MKKLINIFQLFIFIFPFAAFSQDTIVADTIVAEPITEYTEQTFWGNRIINGHSVETTPAGRLDFKISHRMGRVYQGNQSAYNFFGLDQATIRLGLEYGITDWLSTGVGRSTVEKTFDGFVKTKILRQSQGKKTMPITLTYLGGITINSMKMDYPKNYFTNRLAYTNQLIIARKFNDNVSLQIAPTHIHKNLTLTKDDHNDIFACGFAGKFKFSNRMALIAEYFYMLPNQSPSGYNGTKVVNSFSIGVDIYTGKHVFQIHISNSTAMDEKQFITETTDQWKNGNVHIGFNIIRLFTIIDK